MFHFQSKAKTILLLLPCALLYLGTVCIPIVTSFGYSLKYYKLTDPAGEKFVGLANYQAVLTNADFAHALLNSALILLYVLVLGLILSTATALVLNKKTRMSNLLTAIIIIPWALPPLVNGIIWKFIFFPGYGFMNTLLIDLHIITEPISWISNRWLFLCIASIVVTWRIVPFATIVILSNLQSIPDHYYESFYLDGGSRLQAFRNITLPLIMPSLGVVLINLTTTATNVFDEIIALSGYQFQNQTLLVWDYSVTFNFLDFGMGSTISYVVMILTGIFGYMYIKNMTVEHVY